MDSKIKILMGILVIGVVLISGWWLWNNQIYSETKEVTITTDKDWYKQGERVKITIQNKQNKEVNICCPSLCSIGNFPTTIEKYEEDKWKLSLVYCPMIVELFLMRSRVFKKGENYFVVHTLPPKSSFEFEIPKFYESYYRFKKDERVRIVYYLDKGRISIYSNEFTIKPKERVAIDTDDI